MTTLEMILIIYILLNWFLTIMFTILPNRAIKKVFFLVIIICPPLIIGFISAQIKLKRRKRKQDLEKQFDDFVKEENKNGKINID